MAQQNRWKAHWQETQVGVQEAGRALGLLAGNPSGGQFHSSY